jgi:tRNA G18 (ribose-2'-O)-methylase SpoU
VPDPVPVDDPADPRLADYVGLSDAALRQREAADGVFIAEGELVIRALLRSPYPVRSVLVTPARHRRLAADLAASDAPVYIAAPRVMNAVVGFDIHRGAVAAGARLVPSTPDAVIAGARRLVVLEGLNDHENLGALFRNAAGLGMDGVLLSPTCADPLYRRSVRVSLGHVLRVPFARLGDWPDGLATLHRRGWQLVALTPRPEAEPVDVLDGLPGPVALILGAEGPGLSEAALAAADRRVRIPLAAGVDSLNVSTAAAIAFHRLGGGPSVVT